MGGWNHDFDPQHSSPYRRAPGGRGLTASLAACGNTADTDDDATTPNAGTETTAPAESTAPADDDADDDSTDTDDATDSDDDATDSDDDAAESDDDSTDAAGTAGALSVSVQGQGVKALVLDDSGSSGEATALDGKLISGPGGCFAVQPGGQPELLLVGDDVEIGQNPPTLTLDDGTAIKVGDQLNATGVQVNVADVEGIPQQCSQGAADTAWVLQD
ncbi:hypothetical protein [Micrococcus terreus]|uniref:hypothetical protein n=1 Tax=Micrococcus terreus TaxID=574650 RepID=UPI003D731B9F